MVLKKTQGYINLHCKFTIDIRVEIKVKKIKIKSFIKSFVVGY